MTRGAAPWRQWSLLLFILAAIGTLEAMAQRINRDWTQFGWDSGQLQRLG